MIERGRELRGAQQLETDVVIVGSGASGSVVAAQLAEAGQRVLIVEEGGHHTPEEYGRMRPAESLRNLWREGGMSAAIGVGDSPTINVTMGRCVGGSSVLTGGVCFRTPEPVLREWADQRGLDELAPSKLRPYFEEVERIVHVETVPASMRSRSTQLWAEGARKLGLEIKPTRRNTAGCEGFAQCNFGCPKHAKMSVDRNFLPRAIEAGATVLSDCLVERVTTTGGRASGVRGRLLNGRHGKRGDRVTVQAERVVLAAGAAHTPLLLMQSGIGRRSGHVGRHLTLHPSFRMLARFRGEVRGWEGALQSAYTDSLEEEGLMMISVFVPPGAIATGVAGAGPVFTERMSALPHMAMFGGLIHDEGGGRIRRAPGREPLMTYRMSPRDRALVPRIVRTLGDAFIEAGAEELFPPILGHDPVTPDQFRRLDFDAIPRPRFECSSQHPLGTCRMGTEPRDSVVDQRGRAWDLEGLYVVDGSIIPTSLGVNPQLTIMTMALRLGRLLAEG